MKQTKGLFFPGLMSGMQKLASYIRGYNKLGGGNSNIFYFHPENWGRFPIWRFADGLVQPPTSKPI